MLKPIAIIAPALAAVALSACQPEKTPEQKAAEALQQMAQGMASAFGADPNSVPQLDPNALGAAMAQAGAMAGAMGAEMSPEDRAKLNAITGSMSGAPPHPAASAYIAGLDKAFTVLSTIKDDASFEAAKGQLAPIYAEMAAPAATLKAMNDTDREVAFGSAWPQLAGFSMKAMSLMMPLMSNPQLGEKVTDLMDQMPAPE